MIRRKTRTYGHAINIYRRPNLRLFYTTKVSVIIAWVNSKFWMICKKFLREMTHCLTLSQFPQIFLTNIYPSKLRKCKIPDAFRIIDRMRNSIPARGPVVAFFCRIQTRNFHLRNHLPIELDTAFHWLGIGSTPCLQAKYMYLWRKYRNSKADCKCTCKIFKVLGYRVKQGNWFMVNKLIIYSVPCQSAHF